MMNPFGDERFPFPFDGVNLSVPVEPLRCSVRQASSRRPGYSMRGLYAIVDTDALALRGLDPVAFAEAILDARPAALQLRDKHGGAGRTLSLLREIAPLAARAGVPLFANDRPDLAVLARCDGIHVGQDDVPVGEVRRLEALSGVPLRIGLSTSSRQLVEAALREPIDYVAVGPIFATASKEQPDPVVGLPALASLCALVEQVRPGLPVVAIGGISMTNAAQIGRLCASAAVIAALLPEQDGPGALHAASERARALHAALVGARAAPGAAAP
jgi:thiamine-phosphate pyrophosphorylase